MSDYIKREDALNAFRRVYMIPGRGNAKEIYAKQIENTYKQIESVPCADVVERELYQKALSDVVRLTVEGVKQKHGQWIKADDGFDESWVCSVCMEEYVSVDADFIDYAHYCPNCGADMRGDSNV